MSIRVSLRGMLRLTRVDTLRRVHNVGFSAGRLKLLFFQWSIELEVQIFNDENTDIK